MKTMPAMKTTLHITACAAIIFGLHAASVSAATAATPAPQAQREIDGLITALGSSKCEFERNGSWYDAGAAKAHLQTKFDYLRKRNMANTAELFIERGGSRSSMSGKPYHVRCAGQPVVDSAAWFKRKLIEMRAKPAAPVKP